MTERGTTTVADGASEEITRVAGPAREPVATPSVGATTPRSGTTTLPLPAPEMVLHSAEVEQTRRTAIAGLVFNTLGLVAAYFLGGDPTARAIFAASLALAAVNNAYLLYIASSAHRYHERHMIAYLAASAILNAGVIYYLGVFGPVLVMLVLNLYSACLGYGPRVARVSLVGAMAPVVVLGSLMTAGLMADPGLATLSPIVGRVGHAAVVVAFALFLVLVYRQARSARELSMASLRERDEAVRRASHREALFLEARQDLERALNAGGMGRFSDQTLGSYRLGGVLGRGGMGEVYEATHADSGDPAAVKMLLPEALGRPNAVRRFLREVRVAASLDSPHVVRVLEVGDESAPLPYLAMERLHGEDLAQLLRRKTRLDKSAVLDLIRQVGRGLEAASAAGIVHRDLKPHNVFLTEGRVWKILDFGVSKLVDQGGSLTVGEVIGTPQYMAPEQVNGGDVDARTDLYALGAIAYRALTGNPPFRGRDITETLTAVVTEMPNRPTALVRLHRDVDLALALAIAKQPSDRFESGSALAAALEAAFAGRLPRDLKERARELLAALPWREPKEFCWCVAEPQGRS